MALAKAAFLGCLRKKCGFQRVWLFIFRDSRIHKLGFEKQHELSKRMRPKSSPERGLLSLWLSFHISIMGSVNCMLLVQFSQNNMWNCPSRCLASSRRPIEFLSFFPRCRRNSLTSCPGSNHHSLGLQFIWRPQKILLIYAPFTPLDNAFGKMWGAHIPLIQASERQAQLLTLPESTGSLHLIRVTAFSLGIRDGVHLLQLMTPRREMSQTEQWSLIWQEFLGLLACVSVTPSGESVTAHLYNTHNEAQFKIQLCHPPAEWPWASHVTLLSLCRLVKHCQAVTKSSG